MSYGHVYVARIAFGAKMSQTVQAFLEAEAYPGPSLIIAYSHCIAHGYDMAHGRGPAEAGRRRPASGRSTASIRARSAAGEPPLHLDSAPPKADVLDYMRNESALPDGGEGRPRALPAPRSRGPAEAHRARRGLPAARGLTVPACAGAAPRQARPAEGHGEE